MQREVFKMLSIEQFLLNKLSEECGEVVQDVSKAIIHGLDSHNPKTKISNKEKLETEIRDIITMVDMLCKRGILNKDIIMQDDKMLVKEKKVLKHLAISQYQGITNV